MWRRPYVSTYHRSRSESPDRLSTYWVRRIHTKEGVIWIPRAAPIWVCYEHDGEELWRLTCDQRPLFCHSVLFSRSHCQGLISGSPRWQRQSLISAQSCLCAYPCFRLKTCIPRLRILRSRTSFCLASRSPRQRALAYTYDVSCALKVPGSRFLCQARAVSILSLFFSCPSPCAYPFMLAALAISCFSLVSLFVSDLSL